MLIGDASLSLCKSAEGLPTVLVLVLGCVLVQCKSTLYLANEPGACPGQEEAYELIGL